MWDPFRVGNSKLSACSIQRKSSLAFFRLIDRQRILLPLISALDCREARWGCDCLHLSHYPAWAFVVVAVVVVPQ